MYIYNTFIFKIISLVHSLAFLQSQILFSTTALINEKETNRMGEPSYNLGALLSKLRLGVDEM